MGIVIAKNTFAIGLMQCQRITNPEWPVRGNRDNPRLDLDPIPITLVNDLIMESQESRYSMVITHG
jgi:hypothetical protein